MRQCNLWNYSTVKSSTINAEYSNNTHIFTFVRWVLYTINSRSFCMNRTTFHDLWGENMYYCASSIYIFKRKTNPLRYQIQFCIWANWFVVSVNEIETWEDNPVDTCDLPSGYEWRCQPLQVIVFFVVVRPCMSKCCFINVTSKHGERLISDRLFVRVFLRLLNLPKSW